MSNKKHFAPLIIILLLALSGALVSCLSDNSEYDENDSKISLPVIGSEFESPISPVSPLPTETQVVPDLTIKNLADSNFQGCIAFTSNRTNDFEIYKFSANNGNIERLTHTDGLDITPRWSSKGDKIAFASNRDADHGYQIYIMDADGANQHRIGATQPGDNTHPDLSPDGQRIVFQSKRDTNANQMDDNIDIFIMDIDGDNVEQLTHNISDDTNPVWSPDGKKIAFLSERSGQDEVYFMSPEGDDIEQVTQLDVLKSGLQWSPDGQTLLFEGNGDLYTLDIASRQIAPIVIPKNGENMVTPDWGENNDSFLFSSNATGSWNIYFLFRRNSDSFELSQITSADSIDREPNWSSCSE